MIGEIRDFETAEIAIQASLTGHLVLSTLHTNDAASAITRLIDMGVEPFLIASSLSAVLAQRLVRMICPQCKQSFEINEEEARYFEPVQSIPMPRMLYRGSGCNGCKGTGYMGRTGIFEIISINNDVRKMITGRADARMIKDSVFAKGMKTLYIDGLLKVLKGLTTLEEVMRVTQKDYADF
jgi:general secretion pathway protein E